MVTAEVALAMPVLVAAVTAAVWLLACVDAQLRCVDAASTAARLAARGEPVARAVRELAPAGAGVRVIRRGRQITVVVDAVVHPFGSRVRLPSVTVGSRMVSVAESPP